MIQQLFGYLFVLALFVPAAAVILGAISLAVPAPRRNRGHAVNTAMHA
jgi:hypothetical protein